ncbi:MAG: hypothetical protein AB7V00_06215 [Bacilli bacterium]
MGNSVIYCSICLAPYRKCYYYKTIDEKIAIGDLVVVPTGEDNQEQLGIVKEVSMFHVQNVPYPLSKTRDILRKENIEAFPDYLLYRDMILNDDIDVEKELYNKILIKQQDFLETKHIILCDEMHNGVSIKVWAELQNGCLNISGQDIGKMVEHIGFDSDYEYFYKFDLANTDLLFQILKSEYGNITHGLLTEFSGECGCKKLRHFCDKHKINYSYYSYI